jgi:hypothetical protein
VNLKELDALAAKLAREGRIPSPARLIHALRYSQPHRLARITPGEVPAPEHVVYVSPSTRDHSTFEQAAVNVNGPDMQRLESAAARLPSVRGGLNGIGFWRDGAEESRRVDVGDPAHLLRVGAALGRAFRQKAILAFREHPDGTSARHVMVVPQTDPQAIHDAMARHGIEYKTVIPAGPGLTRVEAVDSGDTLGAAFDAYAAEAGAHEHQVRRGTDTFLGDDDRERAQQVFAQAVDTPPVQLARKPKPAGPSHGDVWTTWHPQIPENLKPDGPPKLTRAIPSKYDASGGVSHYRVIRYHPTYNAHQKTWVWSYDKEVASLVPASKIGTYQPQETVAPQTKWTGGYSGTPLDPKWRKLLGIDQHGDPPGQATEQDWRPSEALPEDFYAG